MRHRTNPVIAPILTVLDSPRYLRIRTGASESCVAWIFKAAKEQHLPVDRFFKAVPDAVFFIVRTVLRVEPRILIILHRTS